MTPPSISAEEFQQQCLTLNHRFEALFNAANRALKKILNRRGMVSFEDLTREYATSRPQKFQVPREFWETVRKIRNLITHQTYEPLKYPLVPAPKMVERLEEVVSILKNPIRVKQRFLKEVHRVSSATSLIEVLRKMREKRYSQFPVYDDEKYVGLLTENGISRWLSKQIKRKAGLVDLKGVSVKEVLEQEERRQTCLFVERKKQVIEVVNLFSDKKELEAVIITKNAGRDEKPLGIVTRWDITRLKPGKDA
jgi:predicted transcriptional regulator